MNRKIRADEEVPGKIYSGISNSFQVMEDHGTVLRRGFR